MREQQRHRVRGEVIKPIVEGERNRIGIDGEPCKVAEGDESYAPGCQPFHVPFERVPAHRDGRPGIIDRVIREHGAHRMGVFLSLSHV